MPVVDAGKLNNAVAAILLSMGSSNEEAAQVADHLVQANLKGHDSHGVGMVPHYVRNWTVDLLNLNEHVEIIRDDGAFLVGDGRSGHGQVVAMELTEKAIARAKDQGVCIAGIKMAHHIGRVGTYGERCAAEGLVAIFFVNVAGHGPKVAPFGGTDGRFLTNPICISVPPTKTKPALILDFATSEVALGKARVAMNEERPMAEGTLIDSDGKPTTDASVMFQEPSGAINTFGKHKGYGLALMAELLGAALVGGMTIQPDQEHARDLGIRNNFLAIVIDPDRIGDSAPFLEEVDAVVNYYKASPAADPDKPVLVAGEPELISKAKREAEGIPVDDNTWAELQEAADTAGLGAGEFLRLAEAS